MNVSSNRIQATYTLTAGPYIIAVERKRIRNLHLQIYPESGRIRVSAPLRLSDRAIRVFVMSKQGWITSHLDKAASTPAPRAVEYRSVERHWLEGRCSTLILEEGAAFNRVSLTKDGGILLCVKGAPPAAERGRLYLQWCRARLEGRIEALLNAWTRRMGIQINAWRIRQMKTRWGSCNIARKHVTLSLELARRSDSCLEYIIVHELNHLLEKKHGPAFDASLQRWLPDWRQRDRELKRPLPAAPIPEKGDPPSQASLYNRNGDTT